MNIQDALHSNITRESIAYGYTLAVWGSGAMLISGFQFGPVDVFMFILGGTLGFGALALIAYGGLLGRVAEVERQKFIPGSMIHILASMGTLLLNLVFMESAQQLLSKTQIFLSVGFLTTLMYNMLLLVEQVAYKEIYRISS